MGWVDPRVGLGWVGLGWVEIFSFLVGWVGSWVRNILKNSKTCIAKHKLRSRQTTRLQIFRVEMFSVNFITFAFLQTFTLSRQP